MARAIRIKSISGALTVTVTGSAGGTPTVYTDDTFATTVTLPTTVNSGATVNLYFRSPDTYALSVKANGVEIAGDNNTTRPVDLESSSTLAAYSYDARLTSPIAGSSGPEGLLANLNGSYSAPFKPEAYGAKGDGSTDDTTAMQACIAAAVALGAPAQIRFEKVYSTGLLTCTGTDITFTGPGRLIQKAAGARILDISNSTRCTVTGLSFTGTGLTTPTSNNEAIYAVSAVSPLITRNRFTGINYDSVSINGGSDVVVELNNITASCYGIQFQNGTAGFRVSGNLLDAPSTADATFTHAIAFQTGTPCTDGVITGNVIRGYRNSQGVLLHAGQQITVSNNIFDDMLVGVSINPFATTDLVSQITVVGNYYMGTNATGLATVEGNQGVQVTMPTSGIAPTDITIVGNVIKNANAFLQGTGAGGIALGGGKNVVCTGNVIDAAQGAGIRLTTPITDCVISENIITGVVTIPTGSQQFGIEINSAAAASTGIIRHNFIDGGSGLAAGIRADGSCPAMLLGRNDIVGTFTTAVKNANNFGVLTTSLPANPPVSTTNYQNNTGKPISVTLGAYATVGGTPGTVAFGLGSTSAGVAATWTKQIAGATTSTAVDTVNFRVPPGWFWSVTLTGVTLVSGYTLVVTD